jgi:hypothetical protein
VNRYFRWCACCVVATMTLLILNAFTAAAQETAKPARDKWRPKDGLYIMADTKFTGTCEDAAPYLLELGKRNFVVEERWGCKITKITDTGPGTLRLNMTCNEEDNPDEGYGKDYKEVMTLRRIDEASLDMQLTDKGKFRGPPWRVNYCEKLLEGSDAAVAAADEIRRKPLKDEIDRAAWRPRDGVYAKVGADLDDRCMKSGDAVIDLAEISISSDASHCEVSKVKDATEASVRLEARCDLKPGETGLVARPKNGTYDFVPVGSEEIIITNTGHQTISVQKSRNGEFSELGQLLAYCPDSTQRAYADSKKAK